MSSGLAELGRVLCEEFDERKNTLKSLRGQTLSELKQHREERLHQAKEDRSGRRAERTQLKNKVNELLRKFREDRKHLALELKEEREGQHQEMQMWRKERGEQEKAWYEAVRYMRTKRPRG